MQVQNWFHPATGASPKAHAMQYHIKDIHRPWKTKEGNCARLSVPCATHAAN
jgi:hypothetical protein